MVLIVRGLVEVDIYGGGCVGDGERSFSVGGGDEW